LSSLFDGSLGPRVFCVRSFFECFSSGLEMRPRHNRYRTNVEIPDAECQKVSTVQYSMSRTVAFLQPPLI